MRILIVGDVHGDFSTLLALLRREEPDLVLQVGDFGVWPTALDSLQKFEGSRELELVRRVMASLEGGTTMLNKHHVDYLEPGTADVWDERDLPPGPFRRRKLILYYTQGAWIWARAEESSPALLLAHYDTWQPGYAHRMGGPTDALDVALEICAQIDGVSYEDRHKLIEAQVEALAAARLEAEHQQTDLDV